MAAEPALQLLELGLELSDLRRLLRDHGLLGNDERAQLLQRLRILGHIAESNTNRVISRTSRSES